jgi:hypothetical protein
VGAGGGVYLQQIYSKIGTYMARHPNQQSPFPGHNKPNTRATKTPEYEARAATQQQDIAALEKMQKARALKPPTRYRGSW